MQPGLTIQDLSKAIVSNMALKKDFVASTLSTSMDDEGRMTVAENGSFPILPVAHDQISAMTGVPKKYYDRMANDSPALLAQNVNYWFKKNPAKRMFRTLDKKLRSVNSNSYRRIENEHIAKAAFPVLYDLPGVQFTSAQITEKRLYVHFVVPMVEGEVKRGDVVQAGGIISNSEVGLGSASVTGLLWRLICKNGAKTGEAFRRTHVGRHIEDDAELWAEDTLRADDDAILLKVRDMVKAVVDETRFRQNLLKLQGLTEPKVTGDLTKSVEVLGSTVGATDEETRAILQSVIEGGDLSAWGFVNAVTSQAHKAKSYDRAVELEGMGGQLIDLQPAEWKRILDAGS